MPDVQKIDALIKIMETVTDILLKEIRRNGDMANRKPLEQALAELEELKK